MFTEIDVIALFNGITSAQKQANETQKDVEIKLSDYAVKDQNDQNKK